MDHTAPKQKKRLTRIAVALVLLLGVLCGLLRETVLQLECRDRQSVYEQPQIECPLRLLTAVAKLTGNTEAVGSVTGHGLRVLRGGRTVEQVDLILAVVDAFAQNVNGATPSDLALQLR